MADSTTYVLLSHVSGYDLNDVTSIKRYEFLRVWTVEVTIPVLIYTKMYLPPVPYLLFLPHTP